MLSCVLIEGNDPMSIFFKEIVAGVHNGETWVAGGQRGEECKTDFSLL